MNTIGSLALLVVVTAGLVPQLLFGQVRLLEEHTISLDSIPQEFSIVDLLPTTSDAFLVLSSSMYHNRIMKIDADNLAWETWYGTPDSAINFQRLIKLEIGGYAVVGTKRIPVTPSSGVISRLQLNETGDVLGHFYRTDSAYLLQAVGPLDVHTNGYVASAGRLLQGNSEQLRKLYVAWTNPAGRRVSEIFHEHFEHDSLIAQHLDILANGRANVIVKARRKIKFTPKFYYDPSHYICDSSGELEGSISFFGKSDDTTTIVTGCIAEAGRKYPAFFSSVSYHFPSTIPPKLAINYYDGTYMEAVRQDKYIMPTSALFLHDSTFLLTGYVRDSDTSLTESQFYIGHFGHDRRFLWDSTWGVSNTKNILQELRKIDDHTYIAAGYQGPDSARSLYYVRFGFTPLHVAPRSSNEFATLYPNPAGDRVTIALTTEQSEAQIEIRSVLGHKVLEGRLTLSSGNELSLDIRQLVRGSYFVVLKFADGKRSVLPLVVDR